MTNSINTNIENIVKILNEWKNELKLQKNKKKINDEYKRIVKLKKKYSNLLNNIKE